MIFRTVIFLLLNFGALAIGSLFTSAGVSSDWYANLAKAPWTPPGWVFGAAWTSIMICFSFYMAKAWSAVGDRKTLGILFGIQWVLNVIWNPLFFYFHAVSIGLLSITSLTILVGLFLVRYRNDLKYYSILILPYFIWLLIATSLNGFILIYN
jgi:benzodiazapine receptor